MTTKKEPEPKVPTDILKALTKSAKVTELWKGLTPLARRDFIFWIESAKQPETRKRRIDSLGPRLISGKRRPCCFATVPMNLYKALSNDTKAKVKWKSLTPNERRDFVDWIDKAKDEVGRELRIYKVCRTLAKSAL